MKYVSVTRDSAGNVIVADAYLEQLPILADALPAGARAFAPTPTTTTGASGER